MSEVGRTSCDICIQAYAGADREPPCDTCRPMLEPSNIPFFTLYNYCQGQYIMGPGGPVALCMLAVNQAMDDYQIDKEEKIEFSLKVRRIANVIISAQAEEAAEELKRQNKAR